MHHPSLRTVQFRQDEIVNSYEMKMFQLVESFFPKPYHCLLELPLQRICKKTQNLSVELWKFWVNSRVDIVIMQTAPGNCFRKACLAIECQSSYHDSSDAKRRDSLKASILSMAGVPLIYAQATQYSEIYRFWTANNSNLVKCNLARQNEKDELFAFLHEACLK